MSKAELSPEQGLGQRITAVHFPGSLARLHDRFSRASEHLLFIASECLLKLTLTGGMKGIHEGKGVAHRHIGAFAPERTHGVSSVS